MTFANNDVLAFYKALPFNYRDNVEEHAESIIKKSNPYPQLDTILKRKVKVLDVGCGAGWFSNSIAFHKKCLVDGIDYNPIAIERAKSIAEYMYLDNVTFNVVDIFKYESEQSYDLAVSLGVLHHTNDCKEGVRRVCSFVKSNGHICIGLYHKYGRKPFLEEFENMKSNGSSEEEMYIRYCELDSRFTDETHSRSWFRDQVLHPHETTHTMKEMTELLNEFNMEVIYTTVENEEETYYDLGKKYLKDNMYYPGFFMFIARKNN